MGGRGDGDGSATADSSDIDLVELKFIVPVA
jgi:hypothetical protein